MDVMSLTTIDQYRVIFALPTMRFREDVPGSFFLRYCNAHPFFVVLVVLTRHGEFLFVPASDAMHAWQLPGRRLDRGETFDAAVTSIATSLNLGSCLTEAVAVAEQSFQWGEQTITHQGLVFLVRPGPNFEPHPTVLISKSPPKLPFQNRECIEIAKRVLQKRAGTIPYHEIDSARKNRLAHAIHRHVVKPIMRGSSKALMGRVGDIVGRLRPRSVLDVACGDDWTIQEIADRCSTELAVANDVVLQSIPRYRANVVVSNQSLLDAHFGVPFDLVLCKNTLHHLPHDAHQAVLSKLASLGRNVLLIDVVDPTVGPWHSRLWNAYYRWFLDDQGHEFLTPESLRATILAGGLQIVDHGVLRTGRGDYMYALVSAHSPLLHEYAQAE